MNIADVLDSGYKCTLFCRPRRFGKTFNMTMLRSFFELPSESDPNARSLASLFEGTYIWEAAQGRYRCHQGAYPLVYINLNATKRSSWASAKTAIERVVTDEYARHDYLASSPALNDVQRGMFGRILSGTAGEADMANSLAALCRMLYAHHGKRVILLVDEYDAPVMAAYSAPDGGYYDEMVDFMRGWLTAALKGGDDFLAFACMTGVQRISKESIFSDLNNLSVSTSLSTDFDERYGFTEDEVAALAAYLGKTDHLEEARAWYDGYRFGSVDVYNPWSALNYFKRDCTPGVYWLNTSGNSAVGDAIRQAPEQMLREFYDLASPGGIVEAPIDLGCVFPDIGVRPEAVWSMLYLAGYLTTDDVAQLDDPWRERALRIPNREILRLFVKEIPQRFAGTPTGGMPICDFQRALRRADAAGVESSLGCILTDSASNFDLLSENSYHMLLLGLCFGIEGYASPVSNREAGLGRFDIQICPDVASRLQPGRSLPLITVEVKFLASHEVPERNNLHERLHALANKALSQIADKGCDASADSARFAGRLRYGIAFCGKQVAVASSALDS